jgi:hypothetical protein
MPGNRKRWIWITLASLTCLLLLSFSYSIIDSYGRYRMTREYLKQWSFSSINGDVDWPLIDSKAWRSPIQQLSGSRIERLTLYYDRTGNSTKPGCLEPSQLIQNFPNKDRVLRVYMLSDSCSYIPYADLLEVMTWPAVEWVSFESSAYHRHRTILEGMLRERFPEVREQISILQKTEGDEAESAQLARKNAWRELEKLFRFKVALRVSRSPTSLVPGETTYELVGDDRNELVSDDSGGFGR